MRDDAPAGGRRELSSRLELNSQRTSTHRGCGEPCEAAICGLQEIHARGAVLGVALQLVLDMCGWAVLGAAFEELHRAAAVHAAELRVVVVQSLRDRLYLPERLVAAGSLNATTLHFALIKFFTLGCHRSPRFAGSVESYC